MLYEVITAIVLIDYIEILRDRDGMDRREALVQGGRTRFRPVVLPEQNRQDVEEVQPKLLEGSYNFV